MGKKAVLCRMVGRIPRTYYFLSLSPYAFLIYQCILKYLKEMDITNFTASVQILKFALLTKLRKDFCCVRNKILLYAESSVEKRSELE